MPEAARIGDEISHTQAGLGHLIGGIAATVVTAVASYALGAGMCWALGTLALAFPFGTIAAIGIGLVVGYVANTYVIEPAADFVESAGEAMGKTFTTPTGALIGIGSANVLINNKPAIRASPIMDYAMCSMHSAPPSFVIEGAETVWINMLRAARKGDGMICDAKISSGSDNVQFGSPPVAVAAKTSEEVSQTQRDWIKGARFVAGFAGPGAAKSLPCLVLNIAVALGISAAASGVLGDILPSTPTYGRDAGTSAGTSFGNWLQGKPVHVPSGAKVLPDEVDIHLPGAFPLIWSRFYNSIDPREGVLGQGWNTMSSIELEFRDGKIVFYGHQGREQIYDDLEPNDQIYDATETIKISRSNGGHYFVSYIGHDLTYYFGARKTKLSGERIRALRAMDLNDNGTDFRYNESGHIEELASSAGHILRFVYDAHAAATRLSVIKLGSESDAATLVSYVYNTVGDLIAIKDRSGASVREFAYKNHIMVWQRFASGLESSYVWDRYDHKGRVVEQRSTDGEFLEFQYIDQPLADSDVRNGILPDFSTRQVLVKDQLGRIQRFTCDRRYLVTRYEDPLGGVTTTDWDANQRIVSITDPEGHKCAFGYDSWAQLATVTNQAGQATAIQWHPMFARVERLQTPDGSEWRFEYDAFGNSTETTGPNGYTTLTDYDQRGLAVTHTDAKGGRVQMEYNDQAQMVRYTDCSSKSTRYVYDEKFRLASVVNALNQRVQYGYDELGRLAQAQTPDGGVQSFGYDEAGRLVMRTNAAGKTSNYAYNNRGDLISQQGVSGARVAMCYDLGFRLADLTNENGRKYRFEYDNLDRMVEEHRIDGTRVSVEYNANGHAVAVTYHPGLGDGIDLIGALPDAVDTTNSVGAIRVELIRDPLGRLLEKRAPTHHYQYQYDAAGRLTEALKQAVASQDPSHDASSGKFTLKPLHRTQFAYDALGNLVTETAIDEVSGETHTLTHAHDPLGNRTQTTLPDLASQPGVERALNYLHYGSGHLHQINLSHTSGDVAKDPTSGNVEAIHQLISDIERDALHREVHRTQAGVASRYAYDAMGRRTGVWTRAASLRSHAFVPGQDSAFAHALAVPSALDGLGKQYTYDLSGELRERRHSQQGALRYQYDERGYIKQTDRKARAGQSSSERFDYDPAGNLLDATVAKAMAENHTDHDGQQSIQIATRGAIYDNRVRVFEDKRYAYDGHGRLTEKKIAKHTVQRFDWDSEHRLIAVHTARLGYAAEREAKLKNGTPLANPFGEEAVVPSTTQSTRFDYDALGRRVAKHDAFGTTRFIWEGMRLIEERRGASVVTYVYEPDSYVPLARIDASGQSSAAGGIAAVGEGEGEKLDAQHTQNQSDTAQGINAPFNRGYTTNQGIIDKDTQSPSSPFIKGVSGDVLIAANDSSLSGHREPAETWEALLPPANLDAKQASGKPTKLANIYYFHTDQVGLPEELSDGEGNVRWRASYKTWGSAVSERWEVVDLAGEAVNPLVAQGQGQAQAQQKQQNAEQDKLEQNLRFQGQYLDRDTGLHYNTFRFYDPDIGRFVSPDPIGLNGGTNLHAYAANPLTWIDPLGWVDAPSTLPNTPGIYTITNGNDVYVGSAGGGAQGMNDRVSDPTHTRAQELLNKPGTTVQYREVDLGTATTRAEREHILRHYEQLEINEQRAAGKTTTNARNAEATTKTARNMGDIDTHGANQGAKQAC